MKTASLLSTSSLSLPANSYVYKIVTVKLGNGALAAISSDDSLRVVDAETLQLVAGGGAGAWTEDVHDGVTGLVAGGGWDQQQSVVTAGRDAAVRGWDLRSGEKMFEVKDGGCGCGCGCGRTVWYGMDDPNGLNKAGRARKLRSFSILGLWGFETGRRHGIDAFTSNGGSLVSRAWCLLGERSPWTDD